MDGPTALAGDEHFVIQNDDAGSWDRAPALSAPHAGVFPVRDLGRHVCAPPRGAATYLLCGRTRSRTSGLVEPGPGDRAKVYPEFCGNRPRPPAIGAACGGRATEARAVRHSCPGQTAVRQGTYGPRRRRRRSTESTYDPGAAVRRHCAADRSRPRRERNPGWSIVGQCGVCQRCQAPARTSQD